MSEYTLKTLLHLRDRAKQVEEIRFHQARSEENLEQKRLGDLKTALNQKKHDRLEKDEHSFSKWQKQPINRQVLMLHDSHQKQLQNQEKLLERAIFLQKKKADMAALLATVALERTKESQKDFKSIEKHHNRWQQTLKKAEDMRDDSQNDDLNCSRFRSQTS